MGTWGVFPWGTSSWGIDLGSTLTGSPAADGATSNFCIVGTPYPGGIKLLPRRRYGALRTAALINFHEINDEVRPLDLVGGLEALADDPGSTPALAMPAVAQALLGRGRLFVAGAGLVASEAVAGQTLILRDCSIRTVLAYDISQASVGQRSTIIARGLRGSAAERILYGLELVKASDTEATLRMRWQEAGGVDAAVGGVTFAPSYCFVHLVAVRRVYDPTTVSVTYYLNGRLLGSEVVSAGDIGNGDGGTMTVGCAGDGSGGYGDHFFGVLDCVAVESDAMAPDEVLQEYRRLAVHQPNGYRMVRGSLPPGKTYTTDPDSLVQRWLMAEGDALGLALASGEQTREAWLPDRAFGGALEDWERVLVMPPQGGDRVEDRQARITHHLAKEHGLYEAAILDSLEEPLGLDSADIDVLTFGAEVSDDFSSTNLNTHIWGVWSGNGSVAQASGVLTIAATAADIRWNGRGRLAPFLYYSIPSRKMPVGTDPVLVSQLVELAELDAVGATALVKLAGLTHGVNLGASDMAGVAFYNPLTGDVTVAGLYDDAGTVKLAIWSYEAGVEGAVAVIESPLSDDPVWLRVEYLGDGLYDVQTSSVGESGPWDEPLELAGIDAPVALGPVVVSRASSSTCDVDFDDLRVFAPNGSRALNWYAYRDPADPGTYDLDHAKRVIDREGPAQMYANAIDLQEFQLGVSVFAHNKFGSDPP